MPKEIWSFNQIEELVAAIAQYGTNFKAIRINRFKKLTETQIRNAYYKLKREDPLMFQPSQSFSNYKQIQQLNFNINETEINDFGQDFMNDVYI